MRRLPHRAATCRMKCLFEASQLRRATKEDGGWLLDAERLRRSSFDRRALIRGFRSVYRTDEPKPAALEAHGIRGVTLRCTPKAGVLEELSKLMEAKKLTPVISQTFPMTQVMQAQDQIATRHTRGKIVLKIGDEPVR